MEVVTSAIHKIIEDEKRKLVIHIIESMKNKLGLDNLCILALSEYMADEDILICALNSGLRKYEAFLRYPMTREFALKLISLDPYAVEHIITNQSEFADDEEIILAAASFSGCLGLASSRLKNDRQFVLSFAKSSHYLDVKYVPHFANDKELILESDFCVVESIPDELRNDVDFWNKLVEKNSEYIYSYQCLCDNNTLINALIKLQDRVIMTKRITPTILCKMLQKDGMMLKHIKNNMRTPEMIGIAISQNKEAVQFV